jgi:hypothetical protein
VRGIVGLRNDPLNFLCYYTSLECDFSIRVITPENFKAGKVKQHIRKWETITSEISFAISTKGFG